MKMVKATSGLWVPEAVVHPSKTEDSSQPASGLYRYKQDLSVEGLPERITFIQKDGSSHTVPAASLAKEPPVVTMQEAALIHEQTVARIWPDLIPLYYPRRYVGGGNYMSVKHIGFALASGLVPFKVIGVNAVSTSFAHIWFGLRYITDRKVPLLFIAPDLLKAIRHTKFLDDIDWMEMHMPYEAGILVPPRGFIPHPQGGHAEFIIYFRAKAGFQYPPPIDGLEGFAGIPFAPKINTLNFVCLYSGCHEKGVGQMWMHSHLVDTVSHKTRMHNMHMLKPGDPVVDSGISHPWSMELTEHDHQFMEDAVAITFGVFLAIGARPDLLAKERVSHTVRERHGKPSREFWHPNIVGAQYTLPKVPPQGGTHASPRMHWRRGHFRMQPYGPHRLERKQIWLEPMLVAAEHATLPVDSRQTKGDK